MWMPSFMQVSFQLQGFSCPRRCPDLVLATPPQRWPGGQSGAQTMRNRRHRSSPIERLRLAIDCLPLATRRAMLEGVQAQERIIVGAYTDGGAASGPAARMTTAAAALASGRRGSGAHCSSLEGAALERLAGPDEHDLRHYAGRRQPQQKTDRLGDVLGANHLGRRDVLLDE